MGFAKVDHRLVVLVVLTAVAPFSLSCGSGDALGLEDYQRDLLGLVVGPIIEEIFFPDEPGPAGQSCWDLNGNGVADDEEDTNLDGVVDVQGCRGGPVAVSATSIGIAPCADINDNHTADAEEDINGDGFVDDKIGRASCRERV